MARKETCWQKEKRALSRQLSQIRHDKRLEKEYQTAELIGEKLYMLVEQCGEDIKVLESATKILKAVETIKRDIRGILTVEQAQKMYLERGKYLAQWEKSDQEETPPDQPAEPEIFIAMAENMEKWAQ